MDESDLGIRAPIDFLFEAVATSRRDILVGHSATWFAETYLPLEKRFPMRSHCIKTNPFVVKFLVQFEQSTFDSGRLWEVVFSVNRYFEAKQEFGSSDGMLQKCINKKPANSGPYLIHFSHSPMVGASIQDLLSVVTISAVKP